MENNQSTTQSAPVPPTSVPSASSTTAKLSGSTELLSKAWDLYQKRFTTFFTILLVPAIVTTVFTFIQFQQIAAQNLYSLSFISIISAIVSGVISTWTQMALLYSIKDQTGFVESYKKAVNKILPALWITILSMFMFAGGFIAFVIPGIIFIIWFIFASYILVFEDTGGINALLKSREYVKGRWFDILWKLVFIFIFYFVIYFVISLAIGFLGLPVMFKTIVASLANTLVAPFIPIYLLLIYQNLKAVKGEFTFKPTKNSKIIFYLFGLLGFLIIPIGIGAAILLSTINPVKQLSAARDSSRVFAVSYVQNGLERYKAEKGQYPSFLKEMEGNQIKTSPVDPITKKPLKYRSINNGTDYELCADFEVRTTKCVNSQTPINTYPGTTK